MNEKWVQVKGFPNYAISNYGDIKSVARVVKSRNGYRNKKEKILNPDTVKGGYLRVVLYDDNLSKKKYMVHRLVAEHFIPNPKNKPQVNHLDGDKTNNRLNNLEWVTASENQMHAFRIGLSKPKKGINSHFAKLTKEEVLDIRKQYQPHVFTAKMLANKYGVSQKCIRHILDGNSWAHL